MGKWLDRLAQTAADKSPPPLMGALTKPSKGWKESAQGAFVSFGSAYPKGLRDFSMLIDRCADLDTREAFEERAAILEFDAGMARPEAERAACSGPMPVDISIGDVSRPRTV